MHHEPLRTGDLVEPTQKDSVLCDNMGMMNNTAMFVVYPFLRGTVIGFHDFAISRKGRIFALVLDCDTLKCGWISVNAMKRVV